MVEEQFINKHSKSWAQLEELSAHINKKGLKALSSEDVKSFLHLFRQCSHHLAYARTHYPKSSVVTYLNSLTAKCHSHVYAVKKVPVRELFTYIIYGYPKLLKDNKRFILGSFSFFAAGFVLSLIMVLLNDGNASLFLSQETIDGIKGEEAGVGEWNHPLMSSFIMVNNITVSLKAFVFGITLGIGTIYVLFANGAMLGSLTGLIYLHSDPLNYWSLILPHGVIELTAVFISGAAGLIIAKSILLPGEYLRRHSLVLGAKKAVALIGGVVLFLIIAGTIEGFFTPLMIAAQWKLLFAFLTLIGLSAYMAIPYYVKKR
ncbi:MAG: stage II sporulation protein M [Clostridiaceae bacterium]